MNVTQNQNHISAIIKGSTNKIGFQVRNLPEGWSAAEEVQLITVDTGACDAIVPPEVFKHTQAARHKDYGTKYRACGGETVTNLGVKHVNCLFNEGVSKTIPFQIGDKIIKGLLAASQLAHLGAGLWFGPAPAYESWIIWDKDAFVASAGHKTKIVLKNGTYHVPIRNYSRMITWI